MKIEAKKRKKALLCILAVIMGVIGGFLCSVRSLGADQPFRMEISEDGKFWTVRQALPDAEKEDGIPVFWYDLGTECLTGKVSEVPKLQEGEHYYWYNRTGEVPVGKWRAEDVYAYCTSRSAEEAGNGIVSGSQESCGLPYYSGWMAYCADCGNRILRGNVHMSREAAESINTVDVDKGYYFLCPCMKPLYEQEEGEEKKIADYILCGHLDKYWDAEPHKCMGISYNRYRVVYDANSGNAEGTMAPSFHMYENGSFYEGQSVTPMRTLALCTYNRMAEGYIFTGWNTAPDGTGTFYSDGAEIRNLTSENYEEYTDQGTVTLYAQWAQVQSTLIIEAGEGYYPGENPVTRAGGSLWTLDEGLLLPPAGYTVIFQADGGNAEVSRITGKMSFQRWELAEPAGGELSKNSYRFSETAQNVDIIRAVYASEPVILPFAEKEGYFFGGWYLDRACTRLAGYEGESYLPSNDITLYAKWVDLKLTAIPGYSDKDKNSIISLTWEQQDSSGKAYRIYQRAEDQRNFEQIFSGQEEKNSAFLNQIYGYEEVSRMIIIPSSGFYFLEADGAQGENYGTCLGGFGGKVSGVFYLEKGERIEFTVGGQSGYNGGGIGEDYGNGGGCTIVVSDKKGILMIAGGGGGATISQNGMAGGRETGYGSGEYCSGMNGMAGGGAGYKGGAAGTRIVHVHSEEDGCYRDGTFDALSAEYAIAPVVKEWIDESDKDGDIKKDVYFSSQIGNVEKLIPVKGNTVLDLGVWIQGTGVNLLSNKSYIQVMDQNGIPFFTATLEEIRREWEDFEKRIVLPLDKEIYKGWPPIANVEMRTDWRQSNPDGGEYDYLVGYYTKYPIFYQDGTSRFAAAEFDKSYENPRFYGDYGNEYYPQHSLWNSDILSHRGYNDRPILFWQRSVWYGMSGVHFKYEIPIPEGTTGIYLYGEGMMDATTPHEGKIEVHPVEKCGINFDKITLTGGKELDCDIADVDIPAYGGSNLINIKYALTSFTAAGKCSGNGSLLLRADISGLTEAENWNFTDALDKAAPYILKEESITLTSAGDDCVTVSFEEAEDCGTRYYFLVEAFRLSTGEKMYESNIAECMVKSGIKGYYFLIDSKNEVELNSLHPEDMEKILFSEKGDIEVFIGDELQYLHIAAVDYAGNIADTVHVNLNPERINAAWKISTDYIRISSRVGEQDYGNVYPADEENTYYIRADGLSPFLLAFDSHMHGPARADYQINHQIFDFHTDTGSQRHGTILPYSDTVYSVAVLDPAEFRQWSEGFSVIRDASYTGAARGSNARDVEYYRAFAMPTEQHGKQITVMSAAGAVCNGGVEYSDKENAYSIRLIGDGAGPEIKGLEKLAEWRLIDRAAESVVLEISAEDSLSGVGIFYLEVRNMDNFHEERYLPDEDGIIRVNITEAEPVFSGDFAVSAYAADRVGNETMLYREITEFELMADVMRILPPHEPVLKQGESGILSIEVWGYAEKAEVIFPDFLAEYSQTFLYNTSPQYRKEEKIQFMIPLRAPEEEYEIIVRAYKGDRQLEVHPVIRTVEVSGSVLDELRTRLR